MKNYFAVLVWVLMLASFGCTKEDTLVIERKQWLLVNKKWQLSGMSSKTAGGAFTNEFDSLPSFRKDDYFVFKPDSTYEFNDNMDTMPGKNSKILDVGTWKLDEKELKLEMHSDLYNITYNPAKILELSTSNLSLERTHPGDGSITLTSYKAL